MMKRRGDLVWWFGVGAVDLASGTLRAAVFEF
jgi:hypothetical protein